MYRYAVLLASLLVPLTGSPLLPASFRVSMTSQEGVVLTLSRIYRHGDSRTLLDNSDRAGKRYFLREFRYRYRGRKNWERRKKRIGRLIRKGDIASIHILPDGTVRLGIIFYLRTGRKIRRYREQIRLAKRGGRYYFHGR